LVRFLWAELQLNDLTKVLEPDIKQQLEMLPTGLEETYLQIFQRMSKLPQTSRSLAQRCFLWAFHTKHLINSSQFIDAVSLEHKISGNGTPRYTAHDLNQVTSNLLDITSLGLTRVRPVHFSIQEFFKDATSNPPPECQDFFPEQENAQGQLAIMCLQHLLLDAPPAESLNTILFYCALFFDSHIRSLNTIPEAIMDLLDKLFWRAPHHLRRILAFRFQASAHTYPDLDSPGNPESVDSNFFMRCTKLDQIPQIWSRYADPEVENRHYPEDYLHIASFAGLEDIVNSIISQGADVNRVDSDRLSPLHYACFWDGQPGVMRVLFEAGADWNLDARDAPSSNPDEYETPLIMTLFRGANREVIDCFVKEKTFNFAVFMRSMNKDQPKAITTLLDHGADINQRDERGKTALEIARDFGYVNIVGLLLASGAIDYHQRIAAALGEGTT
jgi:hypothetical protein